ncbi:hypothetical protein KC727_03135 [Candidatus Kaiserbacteria bacterium]|nr:hypothetical protein [Candidatus Kaiserbacteria bacterium]
MRNYEHTSTTPETGPVESRFATTDDVEHSPLLDELNTLETYSHFFFKQEIARGYETSGDFGAAIRTHALNTIVKKRMTLSEARAYITEIKKQIGTDSFQLSGVLELGRIEIAHRETKGKKSK